MKQSAEIRIKRAYDPPEHSDGARFLVDALWPRGLRKERMSIAGWIKAVAPSSKLRKWFGHDPGKWREFQRRYFAELDERPEVCEPLLDAARKGPVTLVYAARDAAHNNAVALKAYLDGRVQTHS